LNEVSRCQNLRRAGCGFAGHSGNIAAGSIVIGHPLSITVTAAIGRFVMCDGGRRHDFIEKYGIPSTVKEMADSDIDTDIDVYSPEIGLGHADLFQLSLLFRPV
jgi:hypothetical protein